MIKTKRRTIELKLGFPKIVCLCGSTRFMEAFQSANLNETVQGNIVLSVGCNTQSDADLFGSQFEKTELKRQLDDLHKRKIDLADEVLVLNVGGYVGESTRSEIEYATATGKPVRYLEPIE
jgi:hypothetical protein